MEGQGAVSPPAAAAATGGDWRKSVTQSYRNKQVRHIAQVLSSIDPGTTVASKMKLAFQFEDQMFKASSGLEDYHKRMNKRLAKLQKKFNPNVVTGGNAPADTSGGGTASAIDERKTPTYQALHSKLVKQYGPTLVYIFEKAPAAVAKLKEYEVQQQQQQQHPNNSEKAAQLKKHTDDAQRWGEQLGIFSISCTDSITHSPSSTDTATAAAAATSETKSVEINSTNFNDSSSLRPTIKTYNDLLQVEQYLQKRLENVKSYVMRYGDADTWTFNNLLERDQQYRQNSTSTKILTTTGSNNQCSSSSQSPSFKEKAAYHLARRLDSLTSRHQQKNGLGGATVASDSSSASALVASEGNKPTDGISSGSSQQQLPHQLLEQARTRFLEAYNGTILQRIPPPTRDNKRETEIGLSHIAKMRAAVNAFEDYFKIPNRHTDGVLLPGIVGHSNTGDRRSKDEGRIILEKINSTAMEGMEYCQKVLKEREGQNIQKRDENDDDDDDDGDEGSTTKMNPEYVVQLQDAWTKSLLKGHKDGVDLETVANMGSMAADDDSSPAKKKLKTCYSTVQASIASKPAYIKAKMLLQNPNKPATNQLLTALARKRARLYQRLPTTSATVTATHLVLDFGTAFQMTIWLSPLLVQIRAMQQQPFSDLENTKPSIVQSSSFLSPSSSSTAWKSLSYGLADPSSVRTLSVWGVKGDYTALGHVVEERLRDASTAATHVLQSSFAKHVKDKVLPLEVEILETSALMDFLHQARTTYIPGWQDIYD